MILYDSYEISKFLERINKIKEKRKIKTDSGLNELIKFYPYFNTLEYYENKKNFLLKCSIEFKNPELKNKLTDFKFNSELNETNENLKKIKLNKFLTEKISDIKNELLSLIYLKEEFFLPFRNFHSDAVKIIIKESVYNEGYETFKTDCIILTDYLKYWKFFSDHKMSKIYFKNRFFKKEFIIKSYYPLFKFFYYPVSDKFLEGNEKFFKNKTNLELIFGKKKINSKISDKEEISNVKILNNKIIITYKKKIKNILKKLLF